jgi:membrane protease subunit HflK
LNGNDSSGPSLEWDLDQIMQRVIQFLKDNPTAIVAIVLVLGFLALLPTMAFQVDRDEEAVILRFGEFTRLVGPGLHFKLPAPIETSYIVNTQRVFSQEFGYRHESANRQTSAFKNESLMLTGDLGVARVKWDVQYTKSEPKKFLFNIRNEEKILREASFSAMRRIVGDYPATEVITTARMEIQQKVNDELQKIMESYRSGIRIVDVVIQSSEPPEPVLPAFKEVDSARQDRERIRNEALRKEEQILNEAEGRVEQMVSEAQGDSAAIINRALGDARYFEQVLNQYQAAPRVTETRMFLDTMKKVIRRSNRTYVVDDEVKSVLPMMRLEGQGSQ